MINPYEKCPVYENENYMLRMVRKEDKEDLLKVYSDEKAVHSLIVIIVVEMIFTIQLKAEWNKRLNIGFGSITDRGLFVGLLFQKQLIKQ